MLLPTWFSEWTLILTQIITYLFFIMKLLYKMYIVFLHPLVTLLCFSSYIIVPDHNDVLIL